jgi:D-ribose pyranase
MRNGGIWHPRLIELIASLGHTDTLVVADAGLPVPAGVESVDLLWARGEPGLVPVLTAILAELAVEEATVATELGGPLLETITTMMGELPVRRVRHCDLKRSKANARAVVRTGETTSFGNVILRAGVVF